MLRVDYLFNTKKIFWIIIFILIIVEICLSTYLIYDAQKIDYLCIAGETCDFVQNSSYAYLFGVKLIYISIFAFLFLLVTFIFSKSIFALVSLIGACAAIYFISIQLFVLKAICSTCMIVDSTMILIGILAILYYFIFEKKRIKKEKSKKQKKK